MTVKYDLNIKLCSGKVVKVLHIQLLVVTVAD